MKTKIIISSMLIVLGIVTSCEKETIRVRGEVTRTEVNFTGYSGLQISDAFNVNVSFSDTEERIIIEANEDIQDRIVVMKEGTDLIVKLKRLTSIRGNATLNIFITTKNLNYFGASGASEIILNSELNTATAQIQLSGASAFTGSLVVDELEFNASGASDADLYGNAGTVNARLSGASSLSNFDLAIDELAIDLSGASNAFLTVMHKIEVKASGGSTLNYKGNAVIERQELSGASDVIKRD